jgi:hypothetical protein
VNMNVEDKDSFTSEIARVTEPGGRYVFYEVFAGGEPAEYYPLPWASDGSISFLEPFGRYAERLNSVGFTERAHQELTDEGVTWFREALARFARDGNPALSLSALLGRDFSLLARNVLRNLEEQRLEVWQAVFRRA